MAATVWTICVVQLLAMFVQNDSPKAPPKPSPRITELQAARRDLLREALAILQKNRPASLDIDRMQQMRSVLVLLQEIELQLGVDAVARNRAYESAIARWRELENEIVERKSPHPCFSIELLAIQSERLAVESHFAAHRDPKDLAKSKKLAEERRNKLRNLIEEANENAAAGFNVTCLRRSIIRAHQELLAMNLQGTTDPEKRAALFEACRKRLEQMHADLASAQDFELPGSIHAQLTKAAAFEVEIQMMRDVKDTPTGLLGQVCWSHQEALVAAGNMLSRRGSVEHATSWILEHLAELKMAEMPSALMLCETPILRLAIYRSVRRAFELWEDRVVAARGGAETGAADWRRARAGRLAIDVLVEREFLDTGRE
jgi:hypothetical protein